MNIDEVSKYTKRIGWDSTSWELVNTLQVGELSTALLWFQDKMLCLGYSKAMGVIHLLGEIAHSTRETVLRQDTVSKEVVHVVGSTVWKVSSAWWIAARGRNGSYWFSNLLTVTLAIQAIQAKEYKQKAACIHCQYYPVSMGYINEW